MCTPGNIVIPMFYFILVIFRKGCPPPAGSKDDCADAPMTAFNRNP